MIDICQLAHLFCCYLTSRLSRLCFGRYEEVDKVEVPSNIQTKFIAALQRQIPHLSGKHFPRTLYAMRHMNIDFHDLANELKIAIVNKLQTEIDSLPAVHGPFLSGIKINNRLCTLTVDTDIHSISTGAMLVLSLHQNIFNSSNTNNVNRDCRTKLIINCFHLCVGS